MKEKIIEGKYCTAKIFTVDDESIAIDQHAEAQIKMICDDKVSENASIRVMPDVHAGRVGPVGLTIAFDNQRIIPNLIGPDIGCGISIFRVFPKHKLTRSDFEKLDNVIRENIPAGDKKRNFAAKTINDATNIIKDTIKTPINADRVFCSFGTLGGGNHFIELDITDEDRKIPEYYLTIHSGSRSLGPVVNKYYNDMGQKILKARKEDVPYEITYIEDQLFKDYVMDCSLCDMFASANRWFIASTICSKMKFDMDLFFDATHSTVYETPMGPFNHRYLLLKGANNASSRLTQIPIPINMRDGVIIVTPKPNIDWNFCLPHGSGRLVKRIDVKDMITTTTFKKDMKGIYSSSVRADTLDEAAIAYRQINDMQPVLEEVSDIKTILKPVYSFKAGGKE